MGVVITEESSGDDFIRREKFLAKAKEIAEYWATEGPSWLVPGVESIDSTFTYLLDELGDLA